MQTLIRNKFSSPVSQHEVAQDWKKHGYSCDLFVDPPDQEWNNFVHSCDELVAVVDGRVRMIIGEDSWDLSPGDQIFIPHGANHSVRNIFYGQSRWLYGYN
jgi:mannose-6-phosphate isomerase-like protein (cupin superfamily)